MAPGGAIRRYMEEGGGEHRRVQTERRNVPASVGAPLRLREHGFYEAASGGVHGAKFPVLTGNAGPRSIRDSGGAGPLTRRRPPFPGPGALRVKSWPSP